MKGASMYKVLATTAILGQTLIGPVLSHADTVPTNAESHSQQQNTYDKTLKNFAFTNFAEDGEKDFKDKPKEAKDWIKGKLEEQEKKMSSSDTQTLQDFTKKDNKEINDYLNKNKGELIDNNPLNLKIEKLDTILRKEETKIDTSIKVYRTIPNMKTEDAEKLKGTILPSPFYNITSLTNIPGSDTIVELTVPQGSHVVYGEANDFAELITERGTGLSVTDVKQVAEKGIVRIKIEATLVSSEDMDKKGSKDKEKENETTLEGINVEEGSTAVTNSGLVPEHVEGFKKVAKDAHTYLLFRPVNKLSTELIKQGAATKGMNVHGKSSDWGPMAGYIPYDADLSKIHGNPAKVEIGNNENKHSVEENKGIIAKINLELNTERIHELTKEKIIANPFGGEVKTGVEGNEHWREISLSQGTKGADKYEFRMYSLEQIDDTPGGKMEIRYRKAGSIDAFQPVEVMAKVVDGTSKPLTADYDMYALAPTVEEIKKNIPVTEWENAMAEQQPLEKLKNITRLLIKYGLMRTPDGEQGGLTDWQKGMIDKLNDEARTAGYTGGTVVNHGTEQDNTKFPEQDQEIFIITPDGKTVLTKSWEDTQKFIRENITNNGHLYYFNRSYNKVAPGNKAQIEWKDPLTQAKSYSIPTQKELVTDLYDIKQKTGIFLTAETLKKVDDIGKTFEDYYNPANRFLQEEGKRQISIFRAFQALEKVEDLLHKESLPHDLYKSYFETVRNRIMGQILDVQTEGKSTIEELMKKIDFDSQDEDRAFDQFKKATLLQNILN
ncbi:hypothetical protein BK708_21310 [Bacillus thuringiensis serovar yunnanensis]|nr:hypothetical protein BK708_21310 [Bacillus thuringiensis serovar yunnanensis]